MPWGTSLMNYAKNSMGALGWAGAAAGTKMAMTSPAARLGMAAGAGAAVGAYRGYNSYDSSMLGGALRGAAVGAGAYGALRYGAAGIRGARPMWNSAAGAMASGSYRAGAGMVARSAGREAWMTMRQDARAASSYIGSGLNKSKAYGSFRAMFR